MSSRATPSPAAYMRPSLNCATGCPSSAAYCRAVRDCVGDVEDVVAGTPLRSAPAPDCGPATAIAGSWLTRAPSNANDGAAHVSGATPSINAKMIRSNVRIAILLFRTTWVGDGTRHGRPDLLGIFPKCT